MTRADRMRRHLALCFASSSESSSSSGSSSSSSSSGSAASTASAQVGRPPTVPNVKQHKKNLIELSRLAPDEDAGSDGGSEPDLTSGQDMFRSTNELPQPSTAPPLPFDQVPYGQQLQELGTITSAVGKQLVIASKPSTRWVGTGSGRKEVVVEPEALGEGSVLCWSDGRVLGLVSTCVERWEKTCARADLARLIGRIRSTTRSVRSPCRCTRSSCPTTLPNQR